MDMEVIVLFYSWGIGWSRAVLPESGKAWECNLDLIKWVIKTSGFIKMSALSPI